MIEQAKKQRPTSQRNASTRLFVEPNCPFLGRTPAVTGPATQLLELELRAADVLLQNVMEEQGACKHLPFNFSIHQTSRVTERVLKNGGIIF